METNRENHTLLFGFFLLVFLVMNSIIDTMTAMTTPRPRRMKMPDILCMVSGCLVKVVFLGSGQTPEGHHLQITHNLLCPSGIFINA